MSNDKSPRTQALELAKAHIEAFPLPSTVFDCVARQLLAEAKRVDELERKLEVWARNSTKWEERGLRAEAENEKLMAVVDAAEHCIERAPDYCFFGKKQLEDALAAYKGSGG